MREIQTQVAIVGAGPAGLLLGQVLDLLGVENVVVERRSREHVERRVRAGVIEHGTSQFIEDAGAGERMRREGLVHHGVELRFDNRSHRIPLSELAEGRAITVYGQQEVVKDLVALRVARGTPLFFDAEVTTIADVTGDRPYVEAAAADGPIRVRCDFVAGCDGSFGPAHQALPASVVRRHERTYPFSWLGVLAEAPRPPRS